MATNENLQKAIEDGDKRSFARFLHEGFDVNMRLNNDGDTLLFMAIREEQEGKISKPVSYGHCFGRQPAL